MPTKSGIIGTVKIKMKDGTYVDLPDPISLEEITTFAEQYEFVKVVRCKDCKWGKEKFGNIECDVDMNAPPEYHGYEWFCPNGERREDEREPLEMD